MGLRSWPILTALAGVAIMASACTESARTLWVYDEPEPWQRRDVLPGGAGGTIVVSDSYSDTLTFLDAATLAPVARLPIGLSPVELEGPHHVKLSPDGAHLYVALAETVPNSGTGPHGTHGDGSVPGYILKIRTANGSLAGQVRVDRNPGDFAVSPDGRTLYVSHFDIKRILEVTQQGGTPEEMRSAIAVVDTETMDRTALVPVCPAEHGIQLAPDGARLFVSCYGSDQVGIVDVSDPGYPVTLVPLGPQPGTLPGALSYGPYAATFGPDGRTLWFSCWESSDLRAFNTSSGQMDLARTIPTGGYPNFGGSQGGSMFIARQSGDPFLPDDRLLVIGSGGILVQEIALPSAECLNAHEAVPVPGDPDRVLVVCEGNHVTPGSVVRVDLTTGEIEARGEAGIFPDAAVFVPEVVR